MSSYNGFSDAIRNRAQRWLNNQMAAKTLARPSICCACGQDKGIVHYHAEDYNEPFGAELYRYPLCYVCHMLLHCRFRSQKVWLRYLKDLRAGKTFLPFMTGNWFRFTAMFLEGGNPAFFIGPERKTLIFDTMGQGGTPLSLTPINIFREPPKQIQPQPNLL